jgi:hypothetical protein
MSTQTTRTIHSPVRLRGLLAVACHICWDMPAGLKGSASKPLPGSGHITGGVQSLSDSTGVVSTRRRFFELSISATLRHRTYAELGTRVRLASRFRESRLKVGP